MWGEDREGNAAAVHLGLSEPQTLKWMEQTLLPQNFGCLPSPTATAVLTLTAAIREYLDSGARENGENTYSFSKKE